MTTLDISLPFILRSTDYTPNMFNELITLDESYDFYYAFNIESDGRLETLLKKYRQ